MTALPQLSAKPGLEEIRGFLGAVVRAAREDGAAGLVELRAAAIRQLSPFFDYPESVVDRVLGMRLASTDLGHPALRNEALHGPAGRFVTTVAPHSEADPAALLVTYLAAAGALFGPKAHVRVESDRHPARLYVLIVGDSSKARKGVTIGRVESIARAASPDYITIRRSGLSSGEGIIWHVRDPVVEGDAVKDPGNPEKRLLDVEGEFARQLKGMTREGNVLSTVLRDAWDHGHLATLTKNPYRATGAHVVVIAAITGAELERFLGPLEIENGFFNRFLFVAARRSKLLPFGGSLTDRDLEPLADELREAIEFAQGSDEVLWGTEAAELWEHVYPTLSQSLPGFLGSLLGRAEAQALRVALIYALLDRSPVIGLKHLEAALAVWEYCENSAALVLGDRLGHPLAEKILGFLREAVPEALNRTMLYAKLGRHVKAQELNDALDLLERQGLAARIREETGGRPLEAWFVL